MPGELEKGGILFAHVIKDADGAGFFAHQADNLASRPAELALQGLNPLNGRIEMLFEESLEDVHEL
jgi:hypothetical protein